MKGIPCGIAGESCPWLWQKEVSSTPTGARPTAGDLTACRFAILAFPSTALPWCPGLWEASGPPEKQNWKVTDYSPPWDWCQESIRTEGMPLSLQSHGQALPATACVWNELWDVFLKHLISVRRSHIIQTGTDLNQSRRQLVFLNRWSPETD